MNSDSRSELTGSITRLLRRLPEQEGDVFERLFHFYFGQLQQFARKRLRNTNRRVRDEDDLVAEVLTQFLMQGGRGELPEVRSREDVLRMLSKRIRQRALNHVRDDRAQKRGGGHVVGESGLLAVGREEGGAGLAGFPAEVPTPEQAVLEVEQVEILHARIKSMVGDPGLYEYFLRWAEGQTCRELEQTFRVSRATVYRKMNKLFDRLQAYASEPLVTDFHSAPEPTSANE